jgi:hypothetical protein
MPRPLPSPTDYEMSTVDNRPTGPIAKSAAVIASLFCYLIF